MRRLLFGTLLGLLGACGSDKPTAAPALAEYEYEIAEVNIANLPKWVGKRVALGDGKVVYGAAGIDPVKKFVLPASTTAAKQSFSLLVDSTCGTTKLPLDVAMAYDTSEDEARRRANQDKAAGSRYPLRLRLHSAAAWPAPEAEVYVDNTPNKQPTTIKIGTIEHEVRAGDGTPSTSKVGDAEITSYSGVGRLRVPVGACAEGRSISIAGKQVGSLAPAGSATLIDVTGGHCYRHATTMYALDGTDIAKHPPPPAPGPVTYVSGGKGTAVLGVKPVWSFIGRPAERMLTEDLAHYQERASLNWMACPKLKG